MHLPHPRTGPARHERQADGGPPSPDSAGRGHGFKALGPLSSVPLRQPTRNINAREVKAALPVCLSSDLERTVPKPPVSAEPAIPQTALGSVRIGANPIASRDCPHGLF